jgi:hypothetical protein
MRRIVALLDKPSTSSFGLLALVTRSEAGTLETEGLAEPSDLWVSDDHYDALAESGSLVQLPRELDRPAETGRLSALWLGRGFEKRAKEIGVSLPPRIALPKANELEDGTLWLLRVDHGYQILDAWLYHAAEEALRERNPDIAKLMAWALPDRDETRMALWFTSKAPRQELEWWFRLLRDQSRNISIDELEVRLARLSEQILHSDRTPVIAFTGQAKSGDNEMAQQVSARKHVFHVSFGQWLSERAREEGKSPARPLLQDLGQQLIENLGALPFCLNVLERLGPKHGFGREVATRSFVLESVRHQSVLEAVRFLVGSERLKLFYADLPEEIRRGRLQQEKDIGDVDRAMHHPTEIEVPDVAAQAEARLDMLPGVQRGTEQVLQLVGAGSS